ncbi:hypothetical protein R6Q59_016772 [Mikania micrantha]
MEDLHATSSWYEMAKRYKSKENQGGWVHGGGADTACTVLNCRSFILLRDLIEGYIFFLPTGKCYLHGSSLIRSCILGIAGRIMTAGHYGLGWVNSHTEGGKSVGVIGSSGLGLGGLQPSKRGHASEADKGWDMWNVLLIQQCFSAITMVMGKGFLTQCMEGNKVSLVSSVCNYWAIKVG